MDYLKIVLLVALVAVVSAELNITLSADGTKFELSGLQESDESLQRVVNGHHAVLNQFPWHATIFVQRVQGQWSFASGALISSQWVVTTLATVRNSRETRVLLGSNRFGHGVQVFSRQTVEHPRFRETQSRLFNIAVIRLNNRVNFSDRIRPIKIGYAGRRLEGLYMRFSGFGSDARNGPYPNMQWAELRVTRNDYCREFFPNEAGTLFFCAMNDRGSGARPGSGDIGAPLVLRTAHGIELVGLTIAGTPNNIQSQGLTGFLNLAQHAKWLNQYLR